jgi:hypothetical protein
MSVPEWAKPFTALSNGQQFRAGLARSLHDGAVLDEFTSVVDRNVAKAASTAMARYVRRNGIKQITIATCHRDVLEFLEFCDKYGMHWVGTGFALRTVKGIDDANVLVELASWMWRCCDTEDEEGEQARLKALDLILLELAKKVEQAASVPGFSKMRPELLEKLVEHIQDGDWCQEHEFKQKIIQHSMMPYTSRPDSNGACLMLDWDSEVLLQACIDDLL